MFMGAAYLCDMCDIENATNDNSAAYIQGWLTKLKSDKKFIVMASGMAQKAVDYILDHQDANPKPVLTVPTKKKSKSTSFSRNSDYTANVAPKSFSVFIKLAFRNCRLTSFFSLYGRLKASCETLKRIANLRIVSLDRPFW